MSCCIGTIAAMEIPLPLNIPPSYATNFKGLEDNIDADVPPSPTLDPPTPNTLASGLFFQRGFVDCAEEALRFLTEKEGMPKDNPVVVGLKEHLLWSSQQFTPASLTSLTPASSASIFTFPPPTQSLVGKGRTSYVASSQAVGGSIRYSPYSVADSNLRQHHPAANRSAAVTCPSVRGFDRVLKENVISSDDLQGVLRCLQYSVEPPVVSSGPNVHTPSANSAGRVSCAHNNSLNDSGLSEVGSLDLTDEVDGVEVENEDDDVENEVFDFMLDSFHCAPSHSLSQSDWDTNVETAAEASYNEGLPVEGQMVTGERVSSPTSQLSLLSSLSSGTHRLTGNSENVTASRIQSLASEILLLLQEEAQADDDDESDHSDIEENDTETEDVDDEDFECEP